MILVVGNAICTVFSGLDFFHLMKIYIQGPVVEYTSAQCLVKKKIWTVQYSNAESTGLIYNSASTWNFE